MNYDKFKEWIGDNAYTGDQWASVEIDASVQLNEVDYSLFLVDSGQTSSMDECGLVTLTRGRELSDAEMVQEFTVWRHAKSGCACFRRPARAWYAVHADPECGVLDVIVHEFDGVLFNSASGDGNSRFVAADAVLPALTEAGQDAAVQ